ncbi:MAG: cation transporter [Deltaproteobacteria bacterium]|nr:cation transporter [Deltaproteobacteria bacterium]
MFYKSRTAFIATLIGLAGNTFLFTIKIIAGLVSGSLALISDAINSLTDIFASVAIFICVRVSDKEADEGHPFGHKRAEPIAGLIVAILAAVLGFEVIRISLARLISGEKISIGFLSLLVPVVTVAAKGLMAWHFKRVGDSVNSPAIRASAFDSLNDVYVSIAAFVGILGASQGYYLMDPIAGFLISLWIIYTGYKIGVENIDYLMGKSPDRAFMELIKDAAKDTPGVKSLNKIRAHYVGNFIHVEMHIAVDKNLSTVESHAIGEDVEKRIEKFDAIEKAFVHIDPV